MRAAIRRILLVNEGEGRFVAYAAGLFLLIGLGLNFGRTSADTMFLKRFGVEYLPHMFFLTGFLMVAATTLYGTMADRLAPSRVFHRLLLGTGVAVAVIWGAIQATDHPAAYIFYFLFYAAASELLVIHFGFYAMGQMNALQSKRLMPLATAGSRVGGIIGGLVAAVLLTWWPVDALLPAWVMTVVAASVLITLWHRHQPDGVAHRPNDGDAGRSRIAKMVDGLRFLRRSPLLLLTALGTFLLILLVSAQEYLVNTILTAHFTDERALAAFFAWFAVAVNAVTLLLQLLLTSRLLNRFGLKTVNLIFPITTAVTFLGLAVAPSYWTALAGRFNTSGVLFAFRAPAAGLFFQALPRHMQGRARAMVSGLALPAGMTLAGLLLILVPADAVTVWLGWGGLAVAVPFIWVKVLKNRAYAAGLTDLIGQQVFTPNPENLNDFGRLPPETVARIGTLLEKVKDDRAASAYVDMLRHGEPQAVGDILLRLAPGLAPQHSAAMPRHHEGVKQPRLAGFRQNLAGGTRRSIAGLRPGRPGRSDRRAPLAHGAQLDGGAAAAATGHRLGRFHSIGRRGIPCPWLSATDPVADGHGRRDRDCGPGGRAGSAGQPVT